MMLTLRCFAACLLALSLSLAPGNAEANKGAHAVELIEEMLADTHRTITSRSPKQLPRTIARYFAWELWTRFLTKPRQQQFSGTQMRRIRQLMPGYIAYLYVDRFAGGMQDVPVVTGTRPARRDIAVLTRFRRANGKALPVGWRVKSLRNGEAKIVDILVGGVSFMLQTREEFVAIIDRAGPGGLIDYLQRKSL
ncbi:MAG: ABC transporter substrate-binding protein [Pseudomonadota bacterium]